MSDIDFAEQVLLVRQGLAWWQRPAPPPAPRLPPVTCDPLPLSLLLSQNFQEMFGGLARAFERRYQVFRRRGHYWLEKRERELWRTYL
ncbi:MAG: hypothetical protein IJV65_04260, partial [Kiritimatiellae bacterium]|nr:hypothetical protein [Kiritimatiellia bacterium]